MQYKCKTIPLNKLIIGSKGVMKPLCDVCKCQDCTNPIEKKTISIMGISNKGKVHMGGAMPGIVILCEGFIV